MLVAAVAAIVCLVVGAPGVVFPDAVETGERVLAAAAVDEVTTGLVAAGGKVFAVIAVGTVLAALIDVVTISAEAAEGVVTIGSVAAAVGAVTILSVAAGGDFVAVE